MKFKIDIYRLSKKIGTGTLEIKPITEDLTQENLMEHIAFETERHLNEALEDLRFHVNQTEE